MMAEMADETDTETDIDIVKLLLINADSWRSNKKNIFYRAAEEIQKLRAELAEANLP